MVHKDMACKVIFRKILVAIDDSEGSQIAFEQALELARATQAELMLLRVVEPFDENYSGDPYREILQASLSSYWKVYWQHWHTWEKTGLAQLQALEERAIAVGVATEFTQSVGDPGKMICALAQSWQADLIVVGRRQLSGLQEFWMGSVSNYVLHHAPCHVLTVQGSSLRQIRSEATMTAATAA